MWRARARHLNTVQNMKEAFERFDYKEDDVLPRREQVKMFRMIEVGAAPPPALVVRAGAEADAGGATTPAG